MSARLPSNPLKPTSSSLPAPGSLASIDAELLSSGLVRYTLQPPTWRAPWLGVDHPETGIPQFYATVPGQDEDLMSEGNVKNGFVGKNVVQTETFSAHQMIYDKLKGPDILSNLANLATLVSAKAQEQVPSYGPSTFRLPSRVVTNDSRRESWIADLANPLVPLSRLSRSVPHGYRNEKLLEMLVQKKVPLSRAVWYIRTNGATEIQSQKTRVGFSVAQYTREWSLVVQEFVRKQLAEISVPSSDNNPPAAGLRLTSARAASKRVLADTELRSTWSKKFSYTLKLVEILYEEHLLEHDSFLRFLVQQVEHSNLAQLPFVLFLAEEYLGEFLLTEPLSARLVAACFARLNQINALPTTTVALGETAASLKALITSTFISLPDAFVASPLWTTHSAQLSKLLQAIPNLEPALADTIRADLQDLRARAEAASEGTQDADTVQPEELETIELLDGITYPAQLNTVHRSLFHKRKRRRSFKDEVALMATWATSSDRQGHHRAYAVAALIAREIAAPPGAGQTKLDVEAAFIAWVDEGSPSSFPRETVVGLLSELIRVGAMSYSLYLQRMIARGETEQRKAAEPSLHLILLRSVALHEGPAGSVAKRRVALRGKDNSSAAARVDYSALLSMAEDELVRLIPRLVDRFTIQLAPDRDCSLLLNTLRHLAEDGVHLVIHRELIPQAVKRLIAHDAPGESSLGTDDLAILVECFEVVGDYWGLLQFVLLLLRSQPSRELVTHVLDTVEAQLDTWTAMGQLAQLAEALLSAHTALAALGTNERRLIRLIRQLAQAGHLEPSSLGTFEAELTKLTNSLSNSTARASAAGQAPQTLPGTALAELQALAFDGSPQAVSQLAVTVWYRYQAFENWAVVVFDTAVQLLSHVPVTTVSAFLREINERLPVELEAQMHRWVQGMRATRLAETFGGVHGLNLAGLVHQLVLEGTVSARGAVELFLLPAWKTLIVEATATQEGASLDGVLLKALETSTAILSLLVGTSSALAPLEGALSPAELVSRQRAQSRRVSLYTSASLPALGHLLALLAIQQDISTSANALAQAQNAAQLLTLLTSQAHFQLLINRDPQTLGTAMLDSAFVKSIPSSAAFRPKLLAALLLALKDGTKATVASLVSSEDWDLFLSGLTMWRLAVSKVEVQACLERLDLDETLAEGEKAEALHTLSGHFLDRVCSGEGHTYLGEQVVRCYHGRASDELVSVAFGRLADALDGLAPEMSRQVRQASLTTLRCTGRLLNTLLEDARATSQPEPLRKVLLALKACLVRLLEDASQTTAGAKTNGWKERQREAILHATHLVAISLRCAPPQLDQATSALLGECVLPCARLAALLSQDYAQEESSLPLLLLDTCAHLLFGLSVLDAPSSSAAQGGSTTAGTAASPLASSFLAELEEDTSLQLPEAALARLARLFGSSSSSQVTYARAGPGTGSSPWDLVAHGAEGPPLGPTSSRLNAGPIDLSLLGASITSIVPPVTALSQLDARSSTSEGTTVSAHASGAPGSFATPNTLSADHARERGRQTNFDWETPAGPGMSTAARDHRRTLTTARQVGSRYDPMGKEKKRLQAQQAHAQQQAKSASGTPAASGSTGALALPEINSSGAGGAKSKGGTPTITLDGASTTTQETSPQNARKRKASAEDSTTTTKATTAAGGGKKTEVLTLSDDEDDTPLAQTTAAAKAAQAQAAVSNASTAPPPAKRGRPAGSTKAAQAAKASAGASGSQARKKPGKG